MGFTHCDKAKYFLKAQSWHAPAKASAERPDPAAWETARGCGPGLDGAAKTDGYCSVRKDDLCTTAITPKGTSTVISATAISSQPSSL